MFSSFPSLPLLLVILGGVAAHVMQPKAKSTKQKLLYEYTCDSIKLNTDYKSLLRSLSGKIQKTFKDRGITKDNVMDLSDNQIIDLSKYWINELNPICTNPKTENAKIIYLILFTILSVKLIQVKQGVALNTDLIIDDWMNLPVYEEIVKKYVNIVQKYLGVNYSTEELESFIKDLQFHKQFPIPQ